MPNQNNGDIRGFFKRFATPKYHYPSVRQTASSASHHVQLPSAITQNPNDVIPPRPSNKASASSATNQNCIGTSEHCPGQTLASQNGLQRQTSTDQLGSSQSSLNLSGSEPSTTTDVAGDNSFKSHDKAGASSRNGPPQSSPASLDAVLEIRSPKQQRHLTDPHPPAGACVSHSLTSSFTSLSSVPMASQASSRRIVKNGQPAVADSDSGSDASSDDSLDDPSSFFANPIKRRKLTPSDNGNNDHDQLTTKRTDHGRKNLRSSTRPSTNTRRPGGSITSPQRSTIQKTSFNYSLTRMLQDHKRRETSNARIAEAEAAIERVENEELSSNSNELSKFSSESVARVLGDDSDERERMQHAMDRTEALQRANHFHLITSNEPQPGDQDFPSEALGTSCRWHELFSDSSTRDHACLSGFASDVAFYESPPAMVLEWMANRVLYEIREDICEAYVDVIRVTIEQHGTSGIEFLASLGSFYNIRVIGRREDSPTMLNDSQLIESQHNNQVHSISIPKGLKHAIAIVYFCAVKSPLDTKINVFWDLMLANIDARIKGNASLRSLVGEALELLLCDLSDPDLVLLEDTIQRLLAHSQDQIEDATRLKLIAELPVTSLRLKQLRRRLSVQSICRIDNLSIGLEPLSLPKWFDTIQHSVCTNQNFLINSITDYDLLNWSIMILDIAIDDGFPSRASIVAARAPLNDRLTTAPVQEEESFTFNQTTKKLPRANDEERAFNKSVDRLSDQLKHISSLIRDSGTGHLGRTEAKSTIERLTTRLDNAVRTRVKPKPDAFAGKPKGLNEEGAIGFLDGIFKKQRGVKGAINVIDENKAPIHVKTERPARDRDDSEEVGHFSDATEQPS